MAIVVEDGTGKTNADSYLSIADADTYFGNHDLLAAWTGIKATAQLNMPILPLDGQTVTIDGVVRTFKDTLTGADQVQIVSTASGTLTNLLQSLDLSGVEGTDYGSGTTAHKSVQGVNVEATTLHVETLQTGTFGNSIALSETMTEVSNTWTASTMSGGANATVSTNRKEIALRNATQYLDMAYADRWKGFRANEDQSLDWPRDDVDDEDEIAVDADDLPTALENATAEAAARDVSETNGLMPDISKPGSIGAKDVALGSLKIRTQYAGPQSQIKHFRRIDQLLVGLVRRRGEVMRG